jgi:hypothetical protein
MASNTEARKALVGGVALEGDGEDAAGFGVELARHVLDGLAHVDQRDGP